MSRMERLREWVVEKLNPAQIRISQDEGSSVGSTQPYTYKLFFRDVDCVNVAVRKVVDACASLDYDIRDKAHEGVVVGLRQKQLNTLLNFRPNPYQSAQEFRKSIFTDFLLDGNAFVHFDGTFMYHLPSDKVEILTDSKTFISGYKYNGTVIFRESEVFYFRDVNSESIYRGQSRLSAARQSIDILYNMHEFQQNFFKNGAVFGMALATENTLSQAAKEKTYQYWAQRYNPRAGGRRPIILD